ncbi:MAG: CYTH domain-containing protein [Synechococcus sp.]
MALEIERRFLVRQPGWHRHIRWSRGFAQGYLSARSDGFTLRVRLSDGEQGWLTLKAAPPAGEASGGASGALALVRQEFEYAIPAGDAEALLALAPWQLRKRRHGLDLPGGDWVVDEFEGANAPLVVAEVELPDAATPVVVPPWCGLEITGRHELSNAALARRPLADWSGAEREGLLGRAMP